MDKMRGSILGGKWDWRLWKIIEKSANEVYLFSRNDFKFVAVNEASLRNTGYSHEELHQMHPWDIKPDFTEAQFKEIVQPLILGKREALEFDTFHKRKDGTCYPVEVRLQLSGDESFPYYFAIITDTTKIQSVVDDLEDQKRQLNHIFNTVTLGMVICDSKGIIRRINSAIVEIFGYKEKELVGKNVKKLMTGHDHEYHDKYIGSYLTTGVKKIIGIGRDVYGRRKNGEVFPMNLAIDDLSTDERIQFVASIRDLTEQERLKEQLHHAQKLEMVGRFTGGISHDFNNLLAIIKGNLSLLKSDLEESKPIDQREALELTNDALDASNRGVTLIKRLLMFARLESAETTPIKLDDAIKSMGGLLNRSIKRTVSLKLSLKAPKAIINVDMVQFESTLMNLVVNGSDAIKDGGEIEIQTRVIRHGDPDLRDMTSLAAGDYVEIAVIDNGVGMTPEVRARAIEPFFTTKAFGAGSGLGLSMAFAFVSQMKGQIKLESDEGVGTTIHLLLPAKISSGKSTDSVNDHDFELIPMGSERILIVEDESIVRRTIKKILERKGYQVVIAMSGDEAADILDVDANFDLVLSDVMMPGSLKGTDLARLIEHKFPHLKTLLVSGNADETVNLSRRAEERFYFLGKPFSPADLILRVREVLNS